jgi:Ca2+-binding EF-hand superfamily protein
MDTDKNGKVSKHEFMNFMSKEFDLIDTNHDGQLDVNELAKFRGRPWVGK